MSVEAWATATIPRLFGILGGFALMSVERIEAFEYEAAVITKQLMQPKHPQKENRIVIIPLNPLTLAPRALHAVHSSREICVIC